MWTVEFEAWVKQSLSDREVVYGWADGIYVKAGLERDKAALLVVMGAMRDGTKEVLAVTSDYRESTDSWVEVFRDLKARGLGPPKLLMADGNPAIWGAAREVWPEAAEQRCWNHKMRNVLDRMPKTAIVFSLNVQQVILLPEAEDFQIQLKEKARRERQARSQNRDMTRYDVRIGDQLYRHQSKRVAILLAVRHLCSSGVAPESLAEAISSRPLGRVPLSSKLMSRGEDI